LKDWSILDEPFLFERKPLMQQYRREAKIPIDDRKAGEQRRPVAANPIRANERSDFPDIKPKVEAKTVPVKPPPPKEVAPERMEVDNEDGTIYRDIGKTIHQKAYDTLAENCDIASDCINTFFELLTKIHPNSVQTLDTYFCSYLSKWFQPGSHPDSDSLENEEDLLKGMEYWESRIKNYTDQIKWTNKGLILIPIHLQKSGHWILAILNLKTLQIELWDSLACKNEGRHFPFWRDAVYTWLTSSNFTPTSFRQRVEREGLEFKFPSKGTFHQVYGNDCGAFICFYAQKRCEGWASTKLQDCEDCTPQFMTKYRLYLQQILYPFVQ